MQAAAWWHQVFAGPALSFPLIFRPVLGAFGYRWIRSPPHWSLPPLGTSSTSTWVCEGRSFFAVLASSQTMAWRKDSRESNVVCSLCNHAMTGKSIHLGVFVVDAINEWENDSDSVANIAITAATIIENYTFPHRIRSLPPGTPP